MSDQLLPLGDALATISDLEADLDDAITDLLDYERRWPERLPREVRAMIERLHEARRNADDFGAYYTFRVVPQDAPDA